MFIFTLFFLFIGFSLVKIKLELSKLIWVQEFFFHWLMILNLCLANEEIMRLNAMFKGMVVHNFGPTRLRDET